MKTNLNLMDMHNHTDWSDGANSSAELIEDAISKNISRFGFTDHYNTVKCPSILPHQLNRYIQEIKDLRELFKHKLSIFAGIEINLLPFPASMESLSFYEFDNLDFVLLEYLDLLSDKISLNSIEKYLKNFKCKVGLAHTDLLKTAEKYKAEGGIDYVLDFMRRNYLFWEINSNWAYECFDSIIYHQDKKQVGELIEKLISYNIEVTVGSDKHSVEDIQLGRFIKANELANYINSRKS